MQCNDEGAAERAVRQAQMEKNEESSRERHVMREGHGRRPGENIFWRAPADQLMSRHKHDVIILSMK